MPRNPAQESALELSNARVTRLTQLYRALSEINQAIVRGREESELLPLICRIAVEHGGAAMAWIGQHDRTTNTLIPVYSFGTGTEYATNIHISASPELPEGQGPTALAYRENRSVVVADYLQDPTTVPWHEAGRRYNWNSSGAFPVPLDNQPFGILSVYHKTKGFFDTETRNLFEELAINISFALTTFKVERQRQAAMKALQSSEQRDQLRSSTLESVARGLPLPEVLNQVIRSIEIADPDMICSILLLDREGQHLVTGAAPTLPDFFCEAIDGITIGMGVGSCGTAAFTGNRVVVSDIAQHPYWQDYRDVALKAGLASAWSEPILSASGRVLGTFAIYHREPCAPDLDQIALIENAANLVGIAIERQHAEEERHLTDLIYQSSSEAMVVTDAQNRIITVNPAFTQMTGYTFEEAYGKSPGILKSGKHDEAFFTVMWQQILADGLWQGEVWNRRKNGELFPVWLTINTTKNKHGDITRFVALASDISHKMQSDELIWRQANFDFLTGLPNRYMFHDRLEQEIRTTRREGSMLALMFIDLDHFKDINDSLGHQMGDLLLVAAAERIGHCIRESDSLARLGGDEFTVILTHLYDIEDAERIAQNILTALSDSFTLGDHTVFISASVGITLYPNDSTQVSQLLSNADQAMYAAKNSGRNGVQYYTHALNDSAQQRLKLISDLRLAVNANQFEIYFQPIVELATGNADKAESLLRWHHPQRGLISPADFIPLAEETGLIIEIGDWVFRQTASYAARLQLTTPLQLSINMSALQFQNDSHQIEEWLALLAQLDLGGQSLNIEITESLLLNAGTNVTAKLLSFRDAGIQVSLDDFGTGYSALSYLKRFDIDYLKIDQSFIQNLDSDSNDLVLSEAIVIMAHKLGLKVIAEGVETEAQRQLLLSIGCDYGQGYLFSRPMPASEFEQFIAWNTQPTDPS